MQADDERSDEGKDEGMAFDRTKLHAAIEGVVSGHPEIAAAYLYGSARRQSDHQVAGTGGIFSMTRHSRYLAIGAATAALAALVACSGENRPDSVPPDSMPPDTAAAATAAPDTGAVPPEVPADIRAHIDEHADLIRLESPEPLAVIESPLEVTGRARGGWYFEASFPVVLVNWDGLIIAEGVATADGEWMTEEFVPFRATLEFETPDYGERGTIILQKHNASGLPEHDDALEVPIRFE